MVTVKAFKSFGPSRADASNIACVPYDVVSDDEVRGITSANPLSFLRVTRPEAEFGDADPERAFAEAKKILDEYFSAGLLAAENRSHLYIYRLVDGERHQTGIVGGCSIDDYDAGRIKKHEKTRPDKVRDRTNHMLALRAQTGLIFLAFRNTNEIRQIISDTSAGEPVVDFVDSKGTRQTVWRVEDSNRLSQAFEDVPELYVADGHHRAESASLARKELREQNPEHTGSEPYNFVMAGIFPSEDLSIMAYNRVVKDLNGLTKDQFLDRLKAQFDVSKNNNERQPTSPKQFSMYLDGEWYLLAFSDSAENSDDPLKSLDVQILQQNVLAPILGIDDPRTSSRIIFVGGGRGIDELEEYVNSGRAAVSFSLYPTSMDQLLSVSDMGEVMPPKSTWFEPKLKDGLFVHVI